MFEITLENKIGNRLQFGAGTPFTIKEFTGLNPPKANINMSEAAFIDGALYNSAKLQTRNVNLAFYIEYDAENNRMEVYKVLQSKHYIKLYFVSEKMDAYLEGYIDSINFTYFAKKQVCTVSIICPFPYFKSESEDSSMLSKIIPSFHFPFPTSNELIFGLIDSYAAIYVENKGMVETGLTFELNAEASVSNPIIINYMTNEFMQINADLVQGDLVTITTGQGNKSVKLLREGVETNIFYLLDKDSTWLQLPMEGANFIYRVESGDPADLVIQIKHYNLFEGV